MADTFTSSKDKDVIRSTYDMQLVRDEYDFHGGELTYFGLPGWRMLDIIYWKEYLKKYIAFEEKPVLALMLLLTAFKHRIESGLVLLEEEIDQAIINNQSFNDQRFPFGFELANLDYEGGIIYKDLKEGSKRVQALEALFSGQGKAKKSFLLLLTINVRKNDKGEIDKVIERIFKENGISDQRIINAVASQQVAVKYKIYVPHLIKRLAEANHFDCHVHEPVRYAGGGNTHMVHFAFTLRFNQKIAAIVPSEQTMSDILRLKMLKAVNGIIQVDDVKFP